jgi:DNA-binding beta-propeller fold protein YncE
MRKMQVVRWIVVVVFMATAVTATPSSGPLGDIRVAVIGDQKAAILSEGELAVLATFDIPKGWVEATWVSADGTRLTVLTEEGLFRAKSPAQLTILDLESMKLLGQHELSFNVHLSTTAGDGRSGMIVFKGCKAKKKRPARPPSLVAWEAGSGTIIATTPLDGLPDSIHLLEATGLVTLAFHGESANLPAKRAPGRLEVLDAASLIRKRVVQLPGPVVDIVADNRSVLFALDRGTDRKKAAETLTGHVYVVDPARDGLIADLEIGIGANLLSWDDQRQTFYVITTSGKARTAAASFQVIQGSSVVAKIELASEPSGVVPAPDRSRYYLFEANGITVVNEDLSAVLQRIPVEGRPSGMLFSDPPSRAFVSFLGSSRVSVVDLTEGRVLADITTGRTGKKIALATAEVLSPTFGPAPYTMPSPETSGLFSPDGAIVFLKNSQTTDLTAVDTQSFEVLDKLPGSMPEIVLDGRALAAIKVKDLVLFDLDKRTILPEMELGMGASVISPSGRYVWTSLGSKTAVFDLEARRRIKTFEGLSGLLVVMPTRHPEPEPEQPVEPTLSPAESEEHS